MDLREASLNSLSAEMIDSKKAISLSEALQRLHKNKDFKTILDSYFLDEPVRLTEALSAEHCQDQQSQTKIMRQLYAVECFKGFLQKVRMEGEESVIALEVQQGTYQDILEDEDDYE